MVGVFLFGGEVIWGVGWNSEGVYTRRSVLIVLDLTPAEDAEESKTGLRDILFNVLRRFPEAHAAVVRALEERVEAIRGKRRNPDSG